MSASKSEQAAFWRDIEQLLARAREIRPLRHADALLDVARLLRDRGEMAPIERLAEALEGWDGRLLVPAPDDTLAPAVGAGDGLVVDPNIAPDGGNLIVAIRGAGFLVRYLTWRDGQQWLAAPGCAALPLGPEIAILGVVVETRRPITLHEEYRYAA